MTGLLCVLMTSSCTRSRPPEPLSDLPGPPASAVEPCQASPVLPLPATREAMAAWVVRNEAALACRDAQIGALLGAWGDMQATFKGVKTPGG